MPAPMRLIRDYYPGVVLGGLVVGVLYALFGSAWGFAWMPVIGWRTAFLSLAAFVTLGELEAFRPRPVRTLVEWRLLRLSGRVQALHWKLAPWDRIREDASPEGIGARQGWSR